MNAQERFEELVARARLDRAPEVDVTDRVMASLRSRARSAWREDLPLAWLAALATVAAIPALIIAWSQLQSWAEPLVVLLGDTPWELLI